MITFFLILIIFPKEKLDTKQPAQLVLSSSSLVFEMYGIIPMISMALQFI